MLSQTMVFCVLECHLEQRPLVKNIPRFDAYKSRHLEPWSLASQPSRRAVMSSQSLSLPDMKVPVYCTCNLNLI